ncbi:hypothetical protein CALVIDRAFT_597289 [Calocera viscosa TUFC12733]|uniref:Uncharacterized protein n=1 Tax=Calocera viscosa (strain TUFC12733) TaxID=1330018 RepID=A0A167NKS5_CALVF|nr:hypothetical protein CALVIDRAFT_597289 [Calocera viscosa TUFC12733]
MPVAGAATPAPDPAPDPVLITGRKITTGAFKRKGKGKKPEEAVVIPALAVPRPAALADTVLRGWKNDMAAISTLTANELTAATDGPMVKTEEPTPDGADELPDKIPEPTKQEKGKAVKKEPEKEEEKETAAEKGEEQKSAVEEQRGEGSRTERELEEARPPNCIEPALDATRSIYDMGPIEYQDTQRAYRRVGFRAGANALTAVYGAMKGIAKEGWQAAGSLRMRSASWVPAVSGFLTSVWDAGFSLDTIWMVFCGLLFYVLAYIWSALVWIFCELWPYRRILSVAIFLIAFLRIVCGVDIIKLCIGGIKSIAGWGHEA